jgi:hypothetical protein
MLQYKDINGKTKNYKFYINNKKVEWNNFVCVLLMMRNLRPNQAKELLMLINQMRQGLIYTWKSSQLAFERNDDNIATFRLEIRE